MVVFDSNHKSMDGNINEKKGKGILRKIVATALIVANIFTFSGCAAKQESSCDINEEHAHFYVNHSNGLGRYIISEKKYVHDHSKTDKTILVTDQNRDEIEFANENNLYKISDNADTIREIESYREDYTEYGDKNIGFRLTPFLGPKLVLIPTTREDWTTDEDKPEHEDIRQTHHYYIGVKAERGEDGKLKPVDSYYADSTFDLPEDCEYVPLYFSVTERTINGQISESKYDIGNKDNGTYIDGKLSNQLFEEETEYTSENANQL